MGNVYSVFNSDRRSSGWKINSRKLSLFSFIAFMIGQFSYARPVFQTNYNNSGVVSLNTAVFYGWKSSLEQSVAQTTVAFSNSILNNNYNFIEPSLPMTTGIIGSGAINTNGSGNDPIDDYSVNMHYQVVYTASELNGIGLMSDDYINGLGWSVTESPGVLSAYTIKIGHTTAVDASTHITSSLTTVKTPFSYVPAITGAGNFDMISFDNNFQWNGTDNIVVDICTSGNPNLSPYGGVRSDSMVNGSRYSRSNTTNQCNLNTNTANSNRPQVRFSYQPGNSCTGTPDPGNTVSSVQNVCANINFTLSLENMVHGLGVTYQWQSANDEMFTSNVSTLGTSASLTLSQTSAKWYRCVVTCSYSSQSTASTPVFVGLNQTSECFCTPSTTGGNTYYISNFTTSGGFININNTSGGSPTGYQDFSTISLVTTTGSTIDYSILCGGNNTYGRAIWVDWNEDGTFQPNERVVSSTNYMSSPLVGSFIVPQNTTLGNKRMRVLISYTPSNPSNSCTNTGSGEYEDYTLSVIQLQNCTGIPEAGTISLSNYEGGTGSNYTVSLNNYTLAEGIVISWEYRINGGSWQASNETTANFTATAPENIGDTVEWKATVTCTNSGQSAIAVSTPFTVVDTCTFTVHVWSSGWGDVTTWTLKDAGGNTILSGGTYSYGFDDIKSVQNPGPVTFSISNWGPYNDNEAFFTVTNENGVIVNGKMGSQNQTFGDLSCDSAPLQQCEGTPNGGTAVANSTSGPTSSVVNFSVSGYSNDTLGLSYDWEYSTNNGETWISTDTSGNEINFTITGPNETVFMVRYAVTCTNSQKTGYSNTVIYTIDNGTNLCVPTYTYGCAYSDYIQKFTLSGEDGTSISRTNGGCEGSWINDTSKSIDLYGSMSYAAQITAGTTGDKVTIWLIDENESAILITPTTTANSGNGNSVILNIPSVSIGTYTMRVMLTWNNNPADECTPISSYGQTIDYTVNITSEAEPCSGTPSGGTATVNPSSGQSGSTPHFSVSGYTSGFGGLSYDWEYSIDNGSTWTSIETSGDTVDLTATGTQGTVFSVRYIVSCSFSGGTAYSNVVNYTIDNTNCTPVYDTGCALDDYIEEFILNGDNNTSISRTNGGCEGDYLNLKSESVDLTAGIAYNAHITAGTSGDLVTIWLIDENWNTYLATPTTAANNEEGNNISLNIPYLPIGTYTMRIMLTWYNDPSDECTPVSSYGQTIDYTVNITSQAEICTGTPNGGIATVNSSSGQSDSTAHFSVSNYSSGFAGLSYDWEYSTNNGETWTNTGNSGNSLDLTMTGSQGTVYLVRYAVNCSFSEETAYSNEVSYTIDNTDCVPSYSTGCMLDDYIEEFTLNGDDNTAIIRNNGSCDGDYLDNRTESVDLMAGATYGAHITAGTSGDLVTIWLIDENWNSYLVTSTTAANNGAGNNIILNIPYQPIGTYTMRIMLTWFNNPSDECTPVSYYGQTIDYTVNITSQAEACTGTPNAGIATVNPTSGQSGSTAHFSVSGYTSGFGGLTYNWEYSTDNGETWTSIGASEDDVDLTMTGSQGTVFLVHYAVKCTLSGETAYSNEVSYTIDNTDCIPSYNTGCILDDYIEEFTLNGENNTSINRTNGSCDGDYLDNRTESVDLTANTTHSAHITAGTSGDKVTIWLLDENWNAYLVTPTSVANDGSGNSINLNIPSLSTGTYTMRIMLTWNNDPTDECTPVSYYGQTIDYTVNIIDVSNCPNLSIAPPNVTFDDSIVLEDCTVEGGIIYALENPCPAGSFIQYSVNGSENWNNYLPLYNIDNAQTIITRCSCESDESITSPESEPVTTNPGDRNACIGNFFSATAEPSPIEGGSITEVTEGNGSYQWGKKVRFKAERNDGYRFVNWTVNGNVVSEIRTYTFYISENTHAVANFELKDHNLTTISSPIIGGETEGSGTYHYGSKVKVKAIPNFGYKFVNWTDSDGNILSETSSFKYEVLGNAKIYANFEPRDYELTTKAAPTFGGTTTGDGIYAYNTKVNVTATPNEGYVFVNWTVNGEEVSTQQNFKYQIQGKVKLIANFEAKNFEVITKPKPTQGGTTTGDGAYAYNSKATVKAIANFGYTFVNWTDKDGNIVSTQKTYKFNVLGRTKLFANFEPKNYAITTVATPTIGGTTTGDGTYAYNSKVIVKAIPNEGYVFVNWTINGEEVSITKRYKHQVLGKAKLVAHFALEGQGGDSSSKPVQSDIFSYYPNPVKDILHIKTNREILSLEIFNLSSQKIMSLNGAKAINDEIDVRLLPQGVYIFKMALDNGEIKTFKIVKK